MNDLLNLAVDFYLQDKQKVLTSVRLTTTQPQDDYFRGTYIYYYHNIFRRRYQTLMRRSVNDPVMLRQQIQLEQARKMEDELPENWHKGMTSEPPYSAELEGDSPRPPDSLTKDGSKVASLAHLLQEKVIKANSKLKKSAPVITLGCGL